MLVALITAPADEPVTLAEAKAHLRIEHSLDDAFINTAITAARQYAEQFCWRGFVTQTWERTLDAFPAEEFIALPKGNLASITSIIYTDENGSAATLASSVYEADAVSVPGFARLKYDQDWPSARDHWNAVKVRYVVGWADVASIPPAIKQGMLLLIGHWYKNRESSVIGSLRDLPFGVESLWAPHRVWWRPPVAA